MTGGPIAPEEVAAWRAHVGRRETRLDVLSAEVLRRYAVAVGADLEVERVAPPLGHWAFFLEARASAELDEDGHPRRGGFMPPVRLPRRMFAAATMRFQAPLVLGAVGELRLTIADVRHRAGKSGDLVFVEVDRSLVQLGEERIAERQTIVYRGAGETVPPVRPMPGSNDESAVVWTPGPVDLFRFSAVTFNAHRIHYDAAYAQQAEGYPGLVVHGPFTAAMLCTLSGRDRPIGTMRSFAFKAAAPLFAGQPIRLTRGGEADAVAAVRCDGVTAMTAEAGFSGDAG